MVAAQSPLGRGWQYPLNTSLQGGLQLSAETQNVEDCIHIILKTAVGERLYRPTFGSRLSELTFAPLNSQTLLLMELYVEEALNQWEPRITLEKVAANPDPEAGRVDITIQYRPKDEPDVRSLVYPFYLLPPNTSS